MNICFICVGLIFSICNILLIKKLKFKKDIYYLIASVLLNIAYIVDNILFSSIKINSFFDLFSINILIYLGLCDIKEGEMPAVLFAVYAAVGVIASIFGNFIFSILFALVVFGVLLLIQKKSKNGMGMGDVYAISCMSLFCTISEAMATIMFSLVLSLVYGLLYSLFKRVSGKTVMIKYIPFLFITTYLLNIIY